jgi:hypothetical protein
MKYGIIVCPNCKKAKGIQLTNKTTRCGRCNKTINLEKVRILYETNVESDLRYKIGLINAELEGEHKEFKKLFPKKKIY